MKAITAALSLLISSSLFSQDVVHWNYTAKKVSDKTYELHLTATIDEGWHVYAQVQPKDAVGIPTKISFNKNPLITLVGKTKEIGTKKKQEIKEVGIT